ncbi:MAG: hypothetical protein R2744_08200 [Bacteroidales bacterium]
MVLFILTTVTSLTEMVLSGGSKVTRAYLGYDYKIDSHLSARIILDMGRTHE